METSSLVQPGQQLEFFETVEELGGFLEVPEQPSLTTGGCADVYRGFWITPQGERVQVAIKQLKTIPKDSRTKEEELKWKADMRLKREVFVWSQTTHPNLHPLLGYRSHPKPRLISPWCSHGNLDDYLQVNSSLTRWDKLQLIFQTACGLKHLHSRTPPICHADIKPENVLINDRHSPALSDFGLSRVVQDIEAQSGFTTSETVKGTLRYMASELSAGQKPNLKSDVYAFGGLMLTVMSGKPPFHGALRQVILRRVMLDEPPIPKDHPNLPAHDPLWKLMRRCWDINPSARPTMQEVLLELFKQIMHEESNPPSWPGVPSGTDEGTSDYPEMDLDIPSAPQHGGNFPVLNLDLVPGGYTLSSMPEAEEARCPIPEEELLATRKTLKAVQINSKVVPVIGKYIGAAAEVGLQLMEILETMNSHRKLPASMRFNPWKLANLLKDLEEQSRQHRGSTISARIHDIQKELKFARGKIEKHDSEFFRNEFSSSDPTSQERSQGTVQKVSEEIKLLIALDTTCLTTEFENAETQEHHRRLLNRLGDGKHGAEGNAIEDVVCLPGTRVEILERIDTWIRDTSTLDRVLWIRGMAGRGKSTIASTVAHSWQYRSSCAIFHFRRGQNTLDARISCALARQLATSLVPEVRNAVSESVRQNEDIADQRLNVQFETLFVAPLAKLIHQPHPILIVVDALDECENPKDAIDFVKLIDQHSASFPNNVKFLLTCRPEALLLRTLEPRKWRVEDLESSADVVNDVARFITQACKQIRKDYGLPEDWPSPSDVKRLVEMSQGLFQWARTVVTYISNGSPVNRLRELLKRPSTWNGLDDLYHQILSKAFGSVRLNPPREELLLQVLGTLLVAPYPVSLEVIAALYGDNNIFEGADRGDMIECLRQDILVDLNSLLLIPTSHTESMRLMHTSIRDLLVNKQRCKERLYYIDTRQHHERLADLCLGFMVRCLKENICNLSDLSKPNSEVQGVIEREVSPAIRYCCRAWSVHLTEGAQWPRLSTGSPCGQQAKFETFSKEKLLYWLEVMSLIGATTEAMMMAKNVYLWLSRYHGKSNYDSKSLAILWNDAQRFIMAFSEPIAFGPLHIYASALAHCPQKTQLWECYGMHARIRTLRGVQPFTWPANLWTRSVGAEVYTVAFHPYGNFLAFGSHDCTIRLCDVQTGTPLGQPLTGHKHHVLSVAFSPDGSVLASGSVDRTIRLWDAQTGTPLGRPLTGHNHNVNSITFSPDGSVLASGSSDGTIRLWDAQTGTPLGQPLTGHSNGIDSIAFSPDGSVLASGSYDGTIRLWDAQTGTPLGQPLTGHSHWINSIAFSPDGSVLASGSYDGTIRLWNAQTRTPLGRPLTGHGDGDLSIAFSPDGSVLASGSLDRTIRLWDPQTGTPLGQPLTDHSHRVRSIAFSPDGTVLASGFGNLMIGLWDAQTGTPLGQPLTGHSDSVSSIAFSPDGSVLASGSGGGAVRLWDAQTGTPLGRPLTGHNHNVDSITFSPDGSILASGSADRTIRLWDAQTGTPLGQPLTGHSRVVTSVAFSPDGSVLASGSLDLTIRLWDAQTRTPFGRPLTGHRGCILSVAFSPDGSVLASGSEDCTIRLWDAQTGTPLGQPLTGHSHWVCSVAFSPDGSVLASGSNDDTIRLWDAHTGTHWGSPITGRNTTICFAHCSHPDSLESRTPPYHIPNLQDHWVNLSSSRVFWLPSQYWVNDSRSPTILLFNGTLVIEFRGTLSIFDVSRPLQL